MRIWLITGASRGFGALFAKEALAAGDAVVATGRNARSIEENLGAHSRLLPLSLDVTQEAQAQAAAAAAVDRFGRIDVLINKSKDTLERQLKPSRDGNCAHQFGKLFDTLFGLLKVRYRKRLLGAALRSS